MNRQGARRCSAGATFGEETFLPAGGGKESVEGECVQVNMEAGRTSRSDRSGEEGGTAGNGKRVTRKKVLAGNGKVACKVSVRRKWGKGGSECVQAEVKVARKGEQAGDGKSGWNGIAERRRNRCQERKQEQEACTGMGCRETTQAGEEKVPRKEVLAGNRKRADEEGEAGDVGRHTKEGKAGRQEARRGAKEGSGSR